MGGNDASAAAAVRRVLSVGSLSVWVSGVRFGDGSGRQAVLLASTRPWRATAQTRSSMVESACQKAVTELDTGSATMGITHRARRVVAYAATVTVIVIEVAVAIVSAVFIAIVTASIAVAIVIATRVPVIAVTMDMVIATAYTHHHAYP